MNPAPISAFLPIVFLAAVFLPLFIAPLSAAADKITGYRPVFNACKDAKGALHFATRQFVHNGLPSLLLVNPTTLETSVASVTSITAASAREAASVSRAPFLAALEHFASQPRLQNAGLTRADSPQKGLFLTVDMCPSRKPFEQEMFAAVAALAQKTGAPVPLGVAMTGQWLSSHPREMEWLKGEISSGKLAVTWINHSYHHLYDPKGRLESNFLLTPGVDFEQEVLATEIALLENGLVPSVFFRFPGLVADGNLMKRLRQLFLIPVGSNAWLAKGELPADGSIILVHGNGNEPQGIKKLLPLLSQENHLVLLPLSQAIAGTGNKY